MAGAVQHQGPGISMPYRGPRNTGGTERAVTFSLQPCDRSSSICSSSSRSTLQAEDESSDYDVPISLSDHRQLLDKAFLDSVSFDTDLHIEESDSESSEIASALLDFSVLDDDGPEGDYDVPGRAVAVDSAYESTIAIDDLADTPTPTKGVSFNLQQESTYDVPTSCILGVADRPVNLPDKDSQATDETDAGYSTDSPGMGSKRSDGGLGKSFSKEVSDVIPKDIIKFMEARGNAKLEITEETPIDLQTVLEDVGLPVQREDSLSVSVGTPEGARDSLVISIDESEEVPSADETPLKPVGGYAQDPPVVMKAGQKGKKLTKRAAVMRNRSVRKSIKELYVFRCSTFVDMLYFNTITEVCKALNKTRGLYQRWLELQEEPGNVLASREELEWTNTELRNATRSIDWDLEDLEETIGIVEKNPRKFKIDASELASRRAFIEQTKEEVKSMKERLNLTKRDRDVTARQPVGDDNSPLKMPQVVTHGNTRYSRLVNEEAESPNSEYIEQTLTQQQMLMTQQDDQLDNIASSMGTLKNMSRQIGSEVDEQAVMLDDFGHDMDNTQSKMENTLSKMAKVMHLSSDRRQWAAIGALSGALAIVVILFFIL